MRGMRKVTFEEYLKFLQDHHEVQVEDQKIPLEPISVSRLEPLPEELTDVSTTLWSFPKRGSWATHRGDYRGNWPPQMARALILRYTNPGDLVLDPMVGSGTTLIEAKLLGRKGIGVDINYNAVILTLHRLYWLEKALEKELKRMKEGGSILPFVSDSGEEYLEKIRRAMKAQVEVYHGDARNLDKIQDNCVDLVATHPPYFNIIKYGSKNPEEGDLSRVRKLEEYISLLHKIAEEIYRVLKPGKQCAILVGDTRMHKHYVPITHYVLLAFLDTGFILQEEVIKAQHKMKSTREVWNKLKNLDFLLIYHEKLFIFRKPSSEKERKKFKYSVLNPEVIKSSLEEELSKIYSKSTL